MADRSQMDRQRTILELMGRDGRQDVKSLARDLRVSGMTIRRDLRQLEQKGLLLRTHGGCVPKVRELTFSEKNQQWVEEKRGIAKRSIQLLKPRNAVYLDTGTTAVHVAQLLPTDLDLRIYTANLRVAMQLFGRPGIEVSVFGGVLASGNPDLTGDMAISQIKRFRFDLAFLGADALDGETGEFLATEQPSAALSRAALARSRSAYVLANSEKLQSSGSITISRLSEEVGLITDCGISDCDLARLRMTKAEIILASIS